MGLRTPFIYDSLCLVLFVWVLTPSETTLTSQKLGSHTHEQKSYKARYVRGVQEDTQWYKIANWITFFGTQNQSLTFPARTMHKGEGNQSCLSRWAPNHHYSLSCHDCTPPSREGFITFFCLSQVIFFLSALKDVECGSERRRKRSEGEGKDEKKG